jgi:hypothetical protein
MKDSNIFEKFVEKKHRVLFDAGALESNRVYPVGETQS